jgi:hypothetical protein
MTNSEQHVLIAAPIYEYLGMSRTLKQTLAIAAVEVEIK